MKKILTSLLAIAAITINAQSIEKQVIGSSGGTFSNATLEITSTTGESTIETFVSGTIILTQGYQQAEVVTTSIEELEITANYKLYPNPTVGNATLELETQNADTQVSILIYSIDGKQIYSKSVGLLSGVKSIVSFDLSNQANGVYYINILNSKSELSEVIQLVKH